MEPWVTKPVSFWRAARVKFTGGEVKLVKLNLELVAAVNIGTSDRSRRIKENLENKFQTVISSSCWPELKLVSDLYCLLTNVKTQSEVLFRNCWSKSPTRPEMFREWDIWLILAVSLAEGITVQQHVTAEQPSDSNPTLTTFMWRTLQQKLSDL